MTHNFSQRHLEFIREIMRAYPEVREGRMFGYPAFFIGRRMFACVYGEGVGLKLPMDDVSRLLATPGTTPFQPHGKRMMREWAQINREQSEDYQRDIQIFEKSIRFVSEFDRRELK